MRRHVGIDLIAIIQWRRKVQVVDRARDPACSAVGACVHEFPAVAAEATELRPGRIADGVGLREAESAVGGDVGLLAAGDFDAL